MTSERGFPRWMLGLPAALTAALAAMHVPYPLAGDQALFLIGGRAVAEGGTLYVDFWDNKQPGIFWFYALASQGFGSDAVGVHCLDALWMLATAALLTLAAYGELRNRWLVALVPASTVGLFYWNASMQFLTQVESLVALPLAACLWIGLAAARRPQRSTPLMFAFGAAAAVVAAFKLVLVPVAAAIWLASVWFARASGMRLPNGALVRWFLAACAGGALVLGAVIAHFAARGALEALVFANLRYPVAALTQVHAKSAGEFLHSARWLIRAFAPLAPLAAFALYDLRRERLGRLEGMALAWLAAAIAAIAVQRFSYWQYHFTLVLVPLGVLAIAALDRLASALRARGAAPRWVAIAACTVAMLPWAASPREGLAGLRALRAASASPGAFAPALRQILDPRQATIASSVAFLAAPDALPGPIYVFGTPQLMLAANRRYAIPTHGWGWEMFLDAQWRALPTQLEAAAPAYVYVDGFYAEQIERRSPKLKRLLARRYETLRADRGGTWYRLRGELLGGGSTR